MPKAVILVTMTPDGKTAAKLADLLLKKKLAACVSAKEGFISTYRWKGKVEKSRETFVMIKTSKKSEAAAMRAVKKAHPYENPEIVSFAVASGSQKYLSWIFASIKK